MCPGEMEEGMGESGRGVGGVEGMEEVWEGLERTMGRVEGMMIRWLLVGGVRAW